MIKITDGFNEKTVTKGMFESLYKKMGYKLVAEKREEKVIKENTPVVEEVVKPVEQEEVEKPVEQKEVKRFDVKKGRK